MKKKLRHITSDKIVEMRKSEKGGSRSEVLRTVKIEERKKKGMKILRRSREDIRNGRKTGTSRYTASSFD
jgi:hypothetical protein